MAKHFIVMSSSYTDGTRVALDITEPEKLNSEYISETIKRIRGKCGEDVPLSTHMIETDSDEWEAVGEYDPFFKDVFCTKEVGAFLEKIQGSRTLTGLDVAKYILSKIKCTHLSLEKLVYLAYADFLCDYSAPLFEDRIYAFRKGPVVDGVYKSFKGSGASYVDHPGSEPDTDVKSGVKELPARSRIMFANDGVKKLSSIDKTIERYGQYSAGQLVEITHRRESPWSHVDSSGWYNEISDDLILKYHSVERV